MVRSGGKDFLWCGGYMELVDFNPNYSNAKNAPKAAAPKTTRRSRKKKTADAPAQSEANEPKAE